MKKLYVAGIPFEVTSEELKAYFEGAGAVVSATHIFNKLTQRPRGFGFVEMSTEEEAQKAIEMFHDKEFGGRRLTVNLAKPMEERPARSDSFDRNRRSF